MIYTNEKNTDEFSFVLKPSRHGVGVFATHDIKKGTFLRLFGDQKILKNRERRRKKKDVPKLFLQYSVDRGGEIMGPKDFGHMHIGWYLNHSRKPNTIHKDRNYNWYAVRDIKKGEEILIDYYSLEEPSAAREKYY